MCIECVENSRLKLNVTNGEVSDFEKSYFCVIFVSKFLAECYVIFLSAFTSQRKANKWDGIDLTARCP